jgi:hypothetical protein
MKHIPRPLYEQVGDIKAALIHDQADTIRSLRKGSRASDFYLNELANSMDVGHFLAAVSMAFTLLEVHARDLLVQTFSMTAFVPGRSISARTNAVEKEIEGTEKQGQSFRVMLKSLGLHNVITETDCIRYDAFYSKYRNPLQHGTFNRFFAQSGNDGTLESILHSPLIRSGKIETFLDTEAEHIIDEVVEFVSRYPLPRSL